MRNIELRCRWTARATFALYLILLGTAGARAQRDPLPSWNKGPAKRSDYHFRERHDRKIQPQVCRTAGSYRDV